MAANVRVAVGWLMPKSLAICVPVLGPADRRKRRELA